MKINFPFLIDKMKIICYNIVTIKNKEKLLKTRSENIMKKFLVDVKWNNNDCLDCDAIQDYIEADNKEEAEEYAMDWLSEHGADIENEVAYVVVKEYETK